MQLNDKGIRLPSKSRPTDQKELIIPEYLIKSLGKNNWALQTFESFPYQNKNEYAEWITEAKTVKPGIKATAIERLAEAKSRCWKYAAK